MAKIQAFLETIVEGNYPQIVVHEAVEALGNMGEENTVRLIEQYRNNNSEISAMVIETCELAQDLIKWNKETNFGASENLDLKKLRFNTNDPAPPFKMDAKPEYSDVGYLTQMMLDSTNHSLFERYRAMFTLRDIYTEESCVAIC